MTKRDDDGDDHDRAAGNDYEVGYGRPPTHTRFKKGQSGNPKGRPPGAKGFTASLKRELEASITVREGNREIRISKAEALAKRLVDKGLRGDTPSIKMAANFDAEISRDITAQAPAETAPQPLCPDDREILRHFADLARDGFWAPDGEDEE